MSKNGYQEKLNRIRYLVRSCLWLAIIAISILILFPRKDQNALIDFVSMRSAASIWMQGGNPYDTNALLRHEREAAGPITKPVIPWNPPWTLPILIPFCLLPSGIAGALWVAVNIALAGTIADWWWRKDGGDSEYRVVSWLTALWFFPCSVAVYFGQMSLIVLAGITGMAGALKSGKNKYLILFALLASIKPHLLLPLWLFLLLWSIRERRWSALIWAASGIGFCSMLVCLLRPSVFWDYVSAAMLSQGPAVWATPTIGTAFRVAFPNIPDWIIFIPGIGGLILSAVLWNRWKTGFDWLYRMDSIVLISIAAASYSWIFDWALLLPCIIRIIVWFRFNRLRQWPSMVGMAVMMAAFVSVQSRGWFPVGAAWFPGAVALLYLWAARRQGSLPISVVGQTLSPAAKADVDAKRHGDRRENI